MQDCSKDAYLIVMAAEGVLRRHEASPFVAEWRSERPEAYEAFRQAFGSFVPGKYRGIARHALGAYPALDEATLAQYREGGWFDLDLEEAARRRFKEMGPRKDGDGVDEDFIDTLEHAVEIYGLLDEAERWEIIRVRREGYSKNADTLGFDIGYWGGNFFSMIADTVVTPTWHPPASEDWAETAERLAGLNEFLLFDDAAGAEAFKAWYVTRNWAETVTPDEGFVVVQVDAQGSG